MLRPPDAPAPPPAVTLSQAFAAAVARHAGRPAVMDGPRVLSYRELDAESRRLAGMVRREAPAASPVVGMLTTHGAEMVIAMLAILRAGKTVVVLDPADPPQRRRDLLAESEAATLVLGAMPEAVMDAALPIGCRIVRMDKSEGAGEVDVVSRLEPHAEDVAFILFTSGSTGKPKGVLATHGNLVASARNYAASAGIGPEDRLTLLSRGQFMAGLSAIFGALLHGAAVLPFDVRSRGFRELAEWLRNERLSVYHSVPTVFRRFCESLHPDDRFPSVRIIKLGGEPVMRHDLKLWHRHFEAHSTLINGLGLSEANGNLCHHKVVSGLPPDDDVIPVGLPLPGVEIVLLDESGSMVPVGNTGEIAFRCEHMSPGYWKSTAFSERLTVVPGTAAGRQFFRTGDLGQIRTDGRLVHLGRRDDVIKLRGLRIEPAHIESAILEDPHIRQCAVGVRGAGSGPKQLVAWVATTTGADFDPDALRESLAGRLPAGLVPGAIIEVPSLPTTSGGKIDRTALPDPSTDRPQPRGAASDPQDALELTVIRLWQKMLRVSRVLPTDDYFLLGGDSLTAAVMVTKVEKLFRAEVDLGVFLAIPTARALAGLVRQASSDPGHQPLVMTRRGGQGAPFFYVPGAGVAGRPLPIESEAGPRPHYWLNYRGQDGVELPQRSIPEIAARFITEVRRIQATGPYLLGGGSFGALVALEAAQQWREQGESVRLLVVEDPVLDGGLAPRPAGPWHHRLERSLLWMLPVGRQFEWSATGARLGLRQWRYRVLVPLARAQSRRRGEPMPKVYRFHDLLNHSIAAKNHYVPQAYPGPVVLLRSEFRKAQRLFEVDPSLGWSRLCPQLQTVALEGEKGEVDHDPARRLRYLATLDSVLRIADPPDRASLDAAAPGA